MALRHHPVCHLHRGLGLSWRASRWPASSAAGWSTGTPTSCACTARWKPEWAFGIALTWLLPHLSPLSVMIFHAVPAPLVLAAEFVSLFVLLLVPTTLMGATLPTLSRYVTSQDPAMAQQVSRLYAFNTWGAVLRALAADFCLIPAVGVAVTGTITGARNLLVAASS